MKIDYLDIMLKAQTLVTRLQGYIDERRRYRTGHVISHKPLFPFGYSKKLLWLLSKAQWERCLVILHYQIIRLRTHISFED